MTTAVEAAIFKLILHFFPFFSSLGKAEKNLGSMGSKRGKAGFLLLTVDFIPLQRVLLPLASLGQ